MKHGHVWRRWLNRLAALLNWKLSKDLSIFKPPCCLCTSSHHCNSIVDQLLSLTLIWAVSERGHHRPLCEINTQLHPIPPKLLFFLAFFLHTDLRGPLACNSLINCNIPLCQIVNKLPWKTKQMNVVLLHTVTECVVINKTYQESGLTPVQQKFLRHQGGQQRTQTCWAENKKVFQRPTYRYELII